MSREQMEADGYGFHHQSDNGKYLIMANGTQAYVISAEPVKEKAKPSIRERLENAKREYAERKPPEKGQPARSTLEHGDL